VSSSGYYLDPMALAVVALQAQYAGRSGDASHMPGAQLGLAYASDPRQKLDILPAGPEDPVLAFIRGGSLM